MSGDMRVFKCHETYETASWLENHVTWEGAFFEIAWGDEEIDRSIAKFSRISILHYYIYSSIAVFNREKFGNNMLDLMPEDIASLRTPFTDYGITLRSEEKFDLLPEGRKDWDYVVSWFRYHEDSFEELWEYVTEEVFFLLFSNRSFLLDFNKTLSEYLKAHPELVREKYRKKDGKIKRDGYIPQWAKKAVFFRDQGRCVLCMKDISGMLKTCTPHYDHIVPLNMWGVNDPCNLQLLCDQCNLEKSGNHSITINRHAEWW